MVYILYVFTCKENKLWILKIYRITNPSTSFKWFSSFNQSVKWLFSFQLCCITCKERLVTANQTSWSLSVGYIPIGKPRVSPLRFLHEGTESAEVATSGIHTNTNTNVFISNQGPIKGKIITMIKYMDTLCNVYTPYNVTIK